MGYITLSAYIDTEVDVDLSMSDIIDNLYLFSDSDMEKLKDYIYKDTIESDENFIIPDNLLDIQKIEILKELFDKLNISDLEDIKNKYINKK